jgi:hypothetical protein
VEVLKQAVDPLVVDRNSLLALRADVELLGDPAVAVLGVLQQDLCKVAPSALTNGPLEAALLFPKLGASLTLPVRPKLGFA